MKTEQEPQNGSNFLEKKFSRRAFLKGATYGAAGVVAVATVGCESYDDSKAIPSATMPKELPTPRLLEDEPGELVEVSGVVVQLSRGRLPIYSIGQDGVREDFNLERMRTLRDRAKSLAEPEIVKMLSARVEQAEQLSHKQDKNESPFHYELPEDTLDKEQLKTFGVEIIQAEGSKLYIRRGAFGEGALLSSFVEGPRKLKIVLMDSQVVSKRFLDDPKYDEVRDRTTIDDNIDVLRTRYEKIDTYYQRLAEVRDVPGLTREAKLADWENLLNLKTDIYWVSDMLTDNEIIESSVIGEQIRNLGMYIRGQYVEKVEDMPAVIFLAVGSRERGKDFVRVYFDGEGKTIVENTEFYRSVHATLPGKAEGYPNSEKISQRWNYVGHPDTYIFDFDTAGQFLRHEFGHDYQMGYLDRPADESEADLKAYESLVSAHEKWTLSGDNSGYYFVFSAEDETGTPGYILTTAEVPDRPSDLS